jgi:ADP-heptose:LPS heptosyltransferase
MKLLFIRFSSIGDIVLTTPVIRCVKQQVKDVEVHFLLKRSFEPVLKHNLYIDKFFFYEEDSDLIQTLKKEKYDVVIDLQKNFRSFKIKTALGVKNYSFDKLNIQKWLLVNFKINLLPKLHIVDRYMQAVKSIGVDNDEKGLDYFIAADDEKVLAELPSSHQNGYIAWVIGAKHATKRLPFEKMVSIGQKIKSPVVLLGGKEDEETGEKISSIDRTKFFNACGKFSLNQSAALVKNSKQVITHDTGLMHIAAAFQKDIISIWGNTVTEFGMYPYRSQVSSPKSQVGPLTSDPGLGTWDLGPGTSTILEVKGLSCRPCTKIGYEKCPKGHFKCMNLLDETIFNSL